MATWTNSFNQSPPSSEDHGLGYLRIQETRQETLERLEPEHSAGSGVTSGYTTDDGRHNPGSARAFVGVFSSGADDSPDNLLAPDGSTAASGPTGFSSTISRTTDEGRIWLDRSGSTNQLRVYHNDTDSAVGRWEAPNALRNHFINGGFQIWQRAGGGTGTITATAASETFTADRWYVRPTGADVVCSRVTNPWAPLPSLGDGPARFAHRLDADAGCTAIVIGYRMSGTDVRTLTVAKEVGGNAYVTFSFRMVNECNQTLTPSLAVNTANAFNNFSAVSSFAPGSHTFSTLADDTDGYFSYTFRLDSIPSQDSPNGLEFELTLTPAAPITSGNIHIGNMMLENGTGRSEFDEIPFLEELERCQPYYEKTFDYAVVPAQNAGVAGALVALGSGNNGNLRDFMVNWNFKRQKVRTDYTMTYYSPLSADANIYNLTDAGTTGVSPTTTINGVADDGQGDYQAIIANVSGIGGANQEILMVHATCDAELT